MTGLSDDAKAVIALATRLGDRQRPSLSPTRWHTLSQRLTDAGVTPSALFAQADIGLAGDERVEISELLSGAPKALLEVDELSQRGIWVRTIADDAYPRRLASRLGRNAPPVLFGVGEAALLDKGGVGIVGSRNVSPEGAEVARSLAVEAVALGFPVVSGAARGVDQLAMNAAYQAGGSVVGILADSLISRIRSQDIIQALDSETTCLITIQHPRAGFSPGSAMGRNKIIYGLADLTVVVATDQDSGGTWAGATEALKAGYGPVGVWRSEGEGPGNRALEERGASSVGANSDLAELLEEPKTTDPIQMSLLE